jgi:hypothetical protein
MRARHRAHVASSTHHAPLSAQAARVNHRQRAKVVVWKNNPKWMRIS